MQTLTFQNITLTPAKIDDQVWLSSSDLAKFLGYSRADKVNDLYNRNADEFKPSMTTIAEVKTNGGMQKIRIFSLRGCHLIAMFARTKVAKAFRQWVLDILDKEAGEPVQVKQTISTEQQFLIRQAIANRCTDNRQHYQTLYTGLQTHFRIPRYQELLARDFDEAIIFIENFVFPRSSNPDQLTAQQWNNLKQLIKSCGMHFRLQVSAELAIWARLRQVTGVKSPQRFGLANNTYQFWQMNYAKSLWYLNITEIPCTQQKPPIFAKF